MALEISAVICTHNRSNYLKGAIGSLIEQNIPREKFEIIVIDNCSNDSTKQVVHQFIHEYQNIRYIYEPKLGLCYARNTGWQNAQGEYIAYLDDDAIACPDWLDKILQGFTEIRPRPGCIGGKVEPIWDIDRPYWLSDLLLHALSVINWSNTPHEIENLAEEWLVGANIAFPIELIKSIGGFNRKLDRSGNKLLSNGDIFLQKQIKKAGLSCYFDPSISIRHRIFKSRISQSWFIQRYYWQGISDSVMYILEESPSYYKRVHLVIAKISSLLRSPRDIRGLFLKTTDPDEFTQKCLMYIKIGQISGLLRGMEP